MVLIAHPIRIRTAEGWKDVAIPGPPGAQGQTGAPGAAGATGAQGIPGTPGAPGVKGDPGNQGIQGIQGVPGNPGSTGAPGAPGAVWRSGAGAPAGALGIVGDWYLNDSNGDVYEKTGASTYTLRDNLTGPQGIQGIQGTQGPVGPSTGPAGGDLSGTYPNPQIATGVIVDADVNGSAAIAESKLNLATDAAAGTGSRRTLGTGAQQATAGNDTRLSNARTPTSHAATHQPGGGDAMAVDAAVATGSLRTLGTGATQAAAGNDSRFTDARAPSGTASGDLSGTYPSPQIAAGVIVDADVNASAAITESKLNLASDAAAGTASRRTLGTGATQAAPGNDSRFGAASPPNGAAGGDLTGTYPNPQIASLVIVDGDISASAAIAESKLALASDAAAGTASRRTLGTGAQQAAAGNDSRFSNARTPAGPAGGDLGGTYPDPTVAKASGNFAVSGTASGKGTVPAGGTNGHVLAKASATDHDLTWTAVAAPSTVNAAAAWAPGDGAPVSSTGTWVGVPIPTLTIEPSDAFTYTANSVTVKDAGWYDVAATVLQNSANNYHSYVSLSTSTTAGDGDIANGQSIGAAYNRASISGSVKLAAGAKVYLYGYISTGTASNLICQTFSISRIGGPAGQMEVYAQPAAPTSTAIGAVWIDTDESPLYEIAGVVKQIYTMTPGYTADRAFNPAATTLNEVASVLATLIDDLKTAKLINP